MQLRTAIFTGLMLLALLMIIAGMVSSYATKTGLTASIWETCTGTNCTDPNPACNAATDAILGDRAMCIIAASFAGLAVVSGFVETIWPDTVMALQNFILGVFTGVFAAPAFAIGYAFWTVEICTGLGTLKENEFMIGAHAPCLTVGFVLVVVACIVEMCGPKGKLDAEREEKEEMERVERELEEARQREMEDEQARREVNQKKLLRSLSQQRSASQPRAGGMARSVGGSSVAGSRSSSVGRRAGPTIPTSPRAGPGGRAFGTPRSGSAVGTPRGGPRAGGIPPPSPRGGGAGSPVRPPLASRSPRVSANNSVSAYEATSAGGGPDFGIGDDGSAWEFDPKTGWYWSDEQGLFFDEARGVFVDPETLQTFDPNTNEWSG